MDCPFCKIIQKKTPAKIIYEDDEVLVFMDLNPARRVHLLTIPKKHVADFIQIDEPQLYAKLFLVVKRMVARAGLKQKGFRIVINGGGAQVVPHLHIHLLGPISKVTDPIV